MHLTSLLTDLGLTEKEANTYLGLLELGAAPVAAIATRADIKRTSLYDILKSLREKNIITTTFRTNKKLFVARSPHHIAKLWRTKMVRFEDALPAFADIQKHASHKPTIIFLDTVEQIKDFYTQVLKEYAGKSYDIIGNTQTFLNWDPIFFDEYRRKRARARIKTRLILTQEDESIAQKMHEKELLNQIRFFPKKYTYRELIRIYPDKVLFLSTKQTGFGIVIESPEFVDSFKKIFAFMWETLAHDN